MPLVLAKQLHATALFWDEFDDISSGPDDYVKWYYNSGNYDDWHYPALVDTLTLLKAGHSVSHPVSGHLLVPTPILILDSSLGRKHAATGKLIDFAIHLDTSMDVALARRILRDYKTKSTDSLSDVLRDLSWYLREGRPLFEASEIKAAADFVVNGDGTTEEILAVILLKLKERGYSSK